MVEAMIGKIERANVGFGGYQDAQFGLTLSFGSKRGSWGTCFFSGYWADRPQGAKWSLEDQATGFSATMTLIRDTLSKANVKNVADLVGVPVEVTFEGGSLKSWRILDEAL